MISGWALSLAVYDILVAIYWGSSATVSWTLALVGQRWPIITGIPFLVLGHICFVRWAPDLFSWRNIWPVLWALAFLAMGALAAPQDPGRPRLSRKRKSEDLDKKSRSET